MFLTYKARFPKQKLEDLTAVIYFTMAVWQQLIEIVNLVSNLPEKKSWLFELIAAS